MHYDTATIPEPDTVKEPNDNLKRRFGSMINKTRKRIWPVSLMMAIAVVGVLTAFAVMAVTPNGANAHEGATDSTHCDDLNDLQAVGAR